MASIQCRPRLRASTILVLAGALLASHAAFGADSAPEAPRTATAPTLLRELVALARKRAPEVTLGQAALTASRSSYASGALAAVGNPQLELKFDRGTQGVTKDVTIDASVWLPIELAGAKQTRGREARDYVALHEALLEQARAIAMARTVRAFGAFAVATARTRVLEEQLRGARAEADYYAQRLAAADATERDAALAALEAARHEALLSETQVDILRYTGELEELTGRPVQTTLELDATPPILAPKRAPAELAHATPTTRVLEAEARYYTAARERLQREAYNPLALGITGGRGDYGEARFGAGVAYTWPLVRANQPERARAEAERVRALEELNLRRDLVARRIAVLEREVEQLNRAVDILTRSALPAANRAVQAALETNRAGKGDWLSVLVSRRDLSALSLRHLELLDRAWLLLGDLVEMTGELP